MATETIPSKKVDIRFGIKNISLIDHKLNLPSDIDYSHAVNKYTYGFEVRTNVLPEISTIRIEIFYKFRFRDIILLELQVSNDYVLEEYFNKVVENEKITSEHFLAVLIDLSVTHTRGIQSTITKNTPISEFYIPFMSKTKIIQSLKKDDKNK